MALPTLSRCALGPNRRFAATPRYVRSPPCLPPRPEAVAHDAVGLGRSAALLLAVCVSIEVPFAKHPSLVPRMDGAEHAALCYA
jgi:hypothetical protein